MKGRAYLWFISLVATIGGLMFGFDVGIISGAIPFIQPYFGWTELQLGWGVSSILVGAILGAFGTGSLTEKYGRKGLLISVALFFAVSCAGMALAKARSPLYPSGCSVDWPLEQFLCFRPCMWPRWHPLKYGVH